MTTPNDSPGTDQYEIQFEQAEFPAETSAVQEQVTRCNACGAAIPAVYFEAGGKIVCAPCRDKIEAMFHQGSRLGCGIKAVLFGTIAARNRRNRTLLFTAQEVSRRIHWLRSALSGCPLGTGCVLSCRCGMGPAATTAAWGRLARTRTAALGVE